jgi:hypothetical protein
MRTRRGLATVRRVVAVAVVVAVVACTAPSDDPAPRDEPSADAVAPATEDAPKVFPAPEDADIVAAVTSAGIRIVAADGSTAYGAEAPATGVELTEDELSSLLAQAKDGSGTPGATLDGLAASKLPMSAFLAGYARGVDTPAAELAASLLEPQDLTHPQTVVFPALVTTLFASDLAHAVGDQAAASLTLSAYAPLSGLCSDVTGALYKGINAVFDALHVKQVNLPKTGVNFLDGLLQGFANLVVDGINYLVEVGRVLVVNLVRYSVSKVLSIVAKVAALAAMVGNFTMMLSPVHVKVETDKSTAAKGRVPDLVHVHATATAQVDIGLGTLEWPQWFEDCAHVAGVDLPPLKPVGEKIDWSILASEPDLLQDAGAPGSPDPVLLDGGPGKAVGSWELVTGTEPADADGDSVSSIAVVKAVVERSQVLKLRRALAELGAGLLTSDLPPVIGSYLRNALVGAAERATDGFVKLLFATGWKAVEVTYHEPGKKQKPKGRHEVWEGSWNSTQYDIAGTFRMDVTRTTNDMVGSLVVRGSDCIGSGSLDAEIHGSHIEFGLIEGGRAAISFSGTIDGGLMQGTYTSGVNCGNDTGPFQATLR